jgi:citrate lyase subunit beta / citryl-CoA lyase
MSDTLPVTYLFVPGNRPDRFDKALASGADAVIIDLEDAVAPEAKAAARAECMKWWRAHPGLAERVLLRINDAATQWFQEDLALVRGAGVRGVVLPKTESADQVAGVKAAMASGFVLPLIESALGIARVDEVARASSVQRLAFGTLDYAVDLDLSGDERGLLYPSCQMAIASRTAGIGSPVAGVTTAIDDEAQLLADLAFARACGFGAKLCIHPKQVSGIRRALAPTPAELAWAQRVLAAAESGQGAVQVDGKMVDRPVILKARAIVSRQSNKGG